MPNHGRPCRGRVFRLQKKGRRPRAFPVLKKRRHRPYPGAELLDGRGDAVQLGRSPAAIAGLRPAVCAPPVAQRRPGGGLQRRTNVGALIMTDRMKAAAAAPVGKLTRTADEQALVDAWQAKTRLDWPPRLKDGEEPGTVVADTKDMELWGARLAKAMGVD